MKKILFFLLTCICLTSCTSSYNNNTQTDMSYEDRDSYRIINLPKGRRVINVYYEDIHYQTRIVTDTMPDDYIPSDKVIYNSEYGNIVYVIKETR